MPIQTMETSGRTPAPLLPTWTQVTEVNSQTDQGLQNHFKMFHEYMSKTRAKS